MPVEGFADPKLHRLCIKCRKWFHPEEGIMDFQAATGPIGLILGVSARMAEHEGKLKFYCQACHAAARKRARAAWYAILSVVAAASVVAAMYLMGLLDPLIASLSV
jgi:hypothetical protein